VFAINKDEQKMNCDKCQKEVFLPFKCPYCGGSFCSEHRLPENHECPNIELAHTQKSETQPVISQNQKSYEYTLEYAPFEPVSGRKKRIYFSAKELKHISIAALIVAGVGLSIGMFPQFYGVIGEDLTLLAAFTIILTSSFFIHETAHKITAQKQGLWAEFRLTLIGAALTLISMLPIIFKIISPGAVMVAGYADKSRIGKISIAGPATNIVLSIAFLTIAFSLADTSTFAAILFFGAFFNAWIAVFNLIPFGILDGFKVFMWSKKIWALAFATSLILTLVLFRMV